MGKRNKFREAGHAQRQEAVCAVLDAHSKRKVAPLVATTWYDFKQQYREKIDAYAGFALRPAREWRCRIKSRSEERRFFDLVRFTFARFRVPKHLERFWLADIDDDFVDDVRPCALRLAAQQRPPARPDLIRWYMVAAHGGSLHKQATHPYLSRLETHHFLNAPSHLTTSHGALWFAVARAVTNDSAAALGISQTRLLNFSIASTFWKDVARFLARNPTRAHERNDLIDFIAAAKQEDEGFSLKGRTLPALRRRMEEWHRALAKAQAICGGSWAGRPLPDVEYEAGREEKTAIWRFRQIKTGDELHREGQRMHHCVASYKALCVSGEVSIWSLTCEYPLGHLNKGVTIEVRRDGVIVQVRGFANRRPHANEAKVVRRWADQHGLTWANWAG